MRFQPELQALAPWVAAFGITPQTRISTPSGEREARDLQIGDLVNTRDNGAQPITNIREAFAAPTERNHFPVKIARAHWVSAFRARIFASGHNTACCLNTSACR